MTAATTSKLADCSIGWMVGSSNDDSCRGDGGVVSAVKKVTIVISFEPYLVYIFEMQSKTKFSHKRCDKFGVISLRSGIKRRLLHYLSNKSILSSSILELSAIGISTEGSCGGVGGIEVASAEVKVIFYVTTLFPLNLI